MALICSARQPARPRRTPIQAATHAPAAASEPAPVTPREFFNAGTRQLRAGKLREAETFLETALASQVETFQPPALYNLGLVRFGQGVEELKKGPAGKPAAGRAQATNQQADDAIRQADDALAGNDVQKMVAAYQRGRGARKELKAATEAVRRAMEVYGTVLTRWERASGDFKSAVELNPPTPTPGTTPTWWTAHCEARGQPARNAAVCSAPGDKSQQLGEKLKELKGRIPAPIMPPGAGDDEEEDDPPRTASRPAGTSRKGRRGNVSLA